MLQDIWNSISWIGVPGALFVVFIIFCLVKGGNNKIMVTTMVMVTTVATTAITIPTITAHLPTRTTVITTITHNFKLRR